MLRAAWSVCEFLFTSRSFVVEFSLASPSVNMALAAFDGWGVDGDFQLGGCAFAVDAGDGGFLRSGMGSDGEGYSACGGAEHYSGPV
jgi:hypothetical protein